MKWIHDHHKSTTLPEKMKDLKKMSDFPSLVNQSSADVPDLIYILNFSGTRHRFLKTQTSISIGWIQLLDYSHYFETLRFAIRWCLLSRTFLLLRRRLAISCAGLSLRKCRKFYQRSRMAEQFFPCILAGGVTVRTFLVAVSLSFSPFLSPLIIFCSFITWDCSSTASMVL